MAHALAAPGPQVQRPPSASAGSGRNVSASSGAVPGLEGNSQANSRAPALCHAWRPVALVYLPLQLRVWCLTLQRLLPAVASALALDLPASAWPCTLPGPPCVLGRNLPIN